MRRGTASTVSDGDTPRRDALHDLIAESEPARFSSLHGSTHSINSDTNITSVSDTWQSEPGHHMSTRMMYGTNKLKMVKPMEGSMTLLQWKLLAMKQTSNSLLTTEERPGVVQRNTVSAISDNEGIGALGGLEELGGSSSGIISKGAMTPAGRAAKTPSAVGRSGVFNRSQATPINPAGASIVSTPLSSKTNSNGATASKNEPEKVESDVNDLFAYLSTKYEVPKNTISSDFSSASSETRAGSKVKVETQPRTRTISPDITPTEDPTERPPYIKKQGSPSSGIGRLFGWS